MPTYLYQTNMSCEGCYNTLRDRLAQHKVTKIKADLSAPEKWVQIQSEQSSDQIQAWIQEAGYTALPSTATVNFAADTFWTDAVKWKRASLNTVNCLIGCSIGDFGMMIYLQNNHPHLPMLLSMSLAMVTGLSTSVILETLILKIREKFSMQQALLTALSMSFISMLVMELAENFTDLLLTGGNMPMHHPFFWIALVISMVAGFVVPLPYNYYKLKKYGKACH